MRIFFIGFMGSGKTKRGKKIATKLGYTFYDLDEIIEKKTNYPISDFFRIRGEEKFREIEREALLEIIKNDNFVLSCGGGTPCFFDNMELMNKTGITIDMKAGKEFIFSRLTRKQGDRPLIIGQNEEELREFIRETLELREVFYNKAILVVDVLKIKNKEIAEKIKSFEISMKK